MLLMITVVFILFPKQYYEESVRMRKRMGGIWTAYLKEDDKIMQQSIKGLRSAGIFILILLIMIIVNWIRHPE